MRDFEQEYKNYINENVPDLWDRIEPNLKEKPIIIESLDDNNKDNQKKKSNIIKLSNFAKYTIPVAACLLILILSREVLFNSRKSEATSDAAAASDSYDESASATEEYVYEDSEASEDVAMMEEAPALEENATETMEESEMTEAEGVRGYEAIKDATGAAEEMEDALQTKNESASNTAVLVAKDMELMEVLDLPEEYAGQGFSSILLLKNANDTIWGCIVEDSLVTEVSIELHENYMLQYSTVDDMLPKEVLQTILEENGYENIPVYQMKSIEKCK